MKMKTYEILINATLVTPYPATELFEFVLNQELIIIECMVIESLATYQIMPVQDYRTRLQGVLFELNHVRINPSIDNTYIIAKLSEALEAIGVEIKHPPHFNDMAQAYRPLGEIMENVRFYFNGLGECTFLCPRARLKLITTQPINLPFRY